MNKKYIIRERHGYTKAYVFEVFELVKVNNRICEDHRVAQCDTFEEAKEIADTLNAVHNECEKYNNENDDKSSLKLLCNRILKKLHK